MMPSRRWFQFSLRGFLVIVTVFAVWFGWNVERARRRGRAIDSIVAAGGEVYYPDYQSHIYVGSFQKGATHRERSWADLRSVPILVKLGNYCDLTASVGSNIAEAIPLSELMMTCSVDDGALKHLVTLSDDCVVTIYGSENVTVEGSIDLAKRDFHGPKS